MPSARRPTRPRRSARRRTTPYEGPRSTSERWPTFSPDGPSRSPPLGPGVQGERRFDGREGEGQRDRLREGRGAQAPAGPLHPRVSGAYGDARGLRHHELRRLHGPRGRQVGKVLHNVRGPGGREGDNDDRRDAGSLGRASPHPEGLLGESWAPVWLLHAGDGDAGGLAARRKSRPDGTRDPTGDLGKPLQVHGLPEHCKVSPGGFECHEGQSEKPRLKTRGSYPYFVTRGWAVCSL